MIRLLYTIAALSLLGGASAGASGLSSSSATPSRSLTPPHSAERAQCVQAGDPLCPPPDITITPSGGTLSTAAQTITITFCGHAYLSDYHILFNSVDVTTSFSFANSSHAGCRVYRTYTGTVTMQAGYNSIDASVIDDLGQNGYANATYNFAPLTPTLSVDPQAADRIDVSNCAASCFETTLGMSTPAYVSLGVPRSVSLLYRSGRAHPLGKVELDAVTTGVPAGTRISLRLMAANGSYATFVNNATTAYFYSSSAGTTRLAAEFDASALATGHYTYTATAQFVNPDGSAQGSASSIGVGVIVVNAQNSPYGAGVDVVGLQRAFPTENNAVLITDGTGSASNFTYVSGYCGISSFGAACTYASPTGDFSTYTRYETYAIRTYPDGTRITYDANGYQTQVADRFGTATNYAYVWNADYGMYALGTVTDPTGQVITFYYRDASTLYGTWKLSSLGGIYTPAGRNLFMGVYPTNDLLHWIDADGAPFAIASYDGIHRLKHVDDRAGQAWDYSYDNGTTSHVASVLAPAVATIAGSQRPTLTFVEPSGVVLRYIANGGGTLGNPVPSNADLRARVVDPGGHATNYSTNRWGQPLSVTDAVSHTTTYTRDASGRPTLVQYFTGATDRYRYDGVNLVMSQAAGKDSTNYRWSLHYAGCKNYLAPALVLLDSTWGPRQSWQGYSWCDGALASATSRYSQADPTTYTTQYTTESYGRVLTETDPAGHVSKVFYNGRYGNADSTVSSGGQFAKTVYDVFGRDSLHWMSGRYRFDPRMGLAVDQTVYDQLNRTTAVYDGLHQTPEIYEYGPVYLTKVRDHMGQVYRRDINALGWPTVAYDPADTVSWSRYTSMQYDVEGQLVNRTNRQGQTLSVQYDALHRPTARTSATGADYFGYSQDGLRTASWNAVSTDSTYGRADGWIDSVVTWMGGQRFRKQYLPDAYERLDSVNVAMSSGAIQFAGRKYIYDPMQNVLSTIRILGSYGVTTTRNGEQAVSGINYLAQNATFRSRVLDYTSTHQLFKDNLQPLTAPDGHSSGYMAAFGYDSLGRIREQTYNPDFAVLVESFGYTGSGELGTHLRAQTAGYCSFSQSVYGGCPGPMQCPAANVDYGYSCNPTGDPFNNKPYNRAAYLYDAASNRSTDSRTASMYGSNYPSDPNLYSQSATTNFGFDTGDRIRTISGDAPYGASDQLAPFSGVTLNFEHDLDGNITRRYGANTDTRLGWNALGQLTSVTVAATGAVVNYDYDASGKLVRRRTNGTADRHFLWDGDDMMAELDGTASTRIGEYVYSSIDHPIALITGANSVASVDYVVQSGRGNVDMLFGTTSSAPIRFHADYTDWGTATLDVNQLPNRMLFKGMMYEGDSTRLYYARNRWYSPESGGFMSEDPLGLAGGMNVYSFAGDDPINGSDPFGLKPFTGKGQKPPNFKWAILSANLIKSFFRGPKIPSPPEPNSVPVAPSTGPGSGPHGYEPQDWLTVGAGFTNSPMTSVSWACGPVSMSCTKTLNLVLPQASVDLLQFNAARDIDNPDYDRSICTIKLGISFCLNSMGALTDWHNWSGGSAALSFGWPPYPFTLSRRLCTSATLPGC